MRAALEELDGAFELGDGGLVDAGEAEGAVEPGVDVAMGCGGVTVEVGDQAGALAAELGTALEGGGGGGRLGMGGGDVRRGLGDGVGVESCRGEGATGASGDGRRGGAEKGHLGGELGAEGHELLFGGGLSRGQAVGAVLQLRFRAGGKGVAKL